MKKLVSLFLVTTLIFGQTGPVVYAIDVPFAPEAPTVPGAPQAPSAPSTPESPVSPIENTPIPEITPTQEDQEREHNQDREEEHALTPTPTPEQSSPASPTLPTQTQEETGNTTTGEVGDARIITGDATNTAALVTTENTNTAQTPQQDGESVIVANNENGTGSTNTSSVDNSDTSLTIQENTATVNTNLEQSANSGSNDSSGNVGNTLIKSGDANVSGTVVTAVNTNVDGVVVSEFTVSDDHTGDIVLDFDAQCILQQCNQSDVMAKNANNGKNSSNTLDVMTSSEEATFQENDATIGNTLILDANSGKNTTNANTNGESVIFTGDANVSANAITFANNNIAGNVIYGVVNIYGDLVGDIIFPEEQLTTCCQTNTTSAQNTNNGSGSDNTVTMTETATDLSFQTNTADIDNQLVLDAQTGENVVSGNTGGDNRVISGNATVDTNVVNVANTNVDGGNWWLVIVNEAGKWIGKIMGAPEGATMAGSEGTTFTTNADGEVVASNTGNGSGSTNTTHVTQSSENTTVQNNDATIVNTLDLSANTGKNQASNNTGGNSTIVTGDATVIANMVNFVNNNIAGGGKLFVTVVNVFGSWIGDFVTPGQQPENHSLAQEAQAPLAIGGLSTSTQPSNSSGNTDDVEEIPVGYSQSEQNALVHAANRSSKTAVSHSNGLSSVLAQTIDHQPQETNLENATVEETDPDATITPIVAGKRIVSLNLAWLILAIAGGILLITLRMIVRKTLRRLSK